MKKILIVIFAALLIVGCTSGHKKHSKRKVTRLADNKGYFYRDDRGTRDVSDDLFWIYYYNMTTNGDFVSSTPSGSWSSTSYANFAKGNTKDLENEENNEKQEEADLSEDPEGNSSLEESESESDVEPEADSQSESGDGDSGDGNGGDAGGDGGGGDGGGGGE